MKKSYIYPWILTISLWSWSIMGSEVFSQSLREWSWEEDIMKLPLGDIASDHTIFWCPCRERGGDISVGVCVGGGDREGERRFY